MLDVLLVMLVVVPVFVLSRRRRMKRRAERWGGFKTLLLLEMFWSLHVGAHRVVCHIHHGSVINGNTTAPVELNAIETQIDAARIHNTYSRNMFS
jgi:hypothetical protein